MGKMTRESVLDNAREYVMHDRNKDYKDPEDNFKEISEYWNLFLSEKLKDEHRITPTDVGMLMVLLKIARLKGNLYKNDNYEDGIGYFACAAECASIEEKQNKSKSEYENRWVVRDGERLPVLRKKRETLDDELARLEKRALDDCFKSSGKMK